MSENKENSLKNELVSMFKVESKRNFIVMLSAIPVMGLGVCLFKLSLMGNDPSSAFVMAVADKIHIDFSIVLLVFNLLCFVFEFIFGRKNHLIGIGTFVNWFFVGIIASLFVRLITHFFGAEYTLVARILIMISGVLVLSFSASLYQTANLGIAPYDALSIMMDKHLPIPYFWCRIITDAVCALLAYLLGGIVGVGTLICALGLGPFISMFNKLVSEKLCDMEAAKRTR